MSEPAADPPDREAPEEPAEPTVAVQVKLTPGHTIPAGTRLHDYRIDRVLGEGGFGIVYLATDIALERQVAIKEYLPSSMAARAGQSLTVLVKSPTHEETFQIGLKSFVNEAKLLAHFDHPALLKVHQFWEANGTAYMAMPYYQGKTLKESLAKLGRLPTEAEVRAWLMPLLDALEVLHNEHCYHRDIAPDNILLTDHGPLLLDFGAARRVIGDLTHALTAMLKPGFAPIEQYGEMPGVTQGPWTDIFALASVLYAAISGGRTVAAVERLLNDQLRPLSSVAAGRCGRAFLAAIDAALAIHPKDRPQSIAEFRALLTADDTQPLDLAELKALGIAPPGGQTMLMPDFDPTQLSTGNPLLAPREPERPAPTPPAAARAAAPLPEMPLPTVVLPAPAPPRQAPPTPAPTPAPASPPALSPAPPPPRRALLLGLAGLAGLGAAAWGGYRLLNEPQPNPAPALPPAAPAAAPTPPELPAASAASAVETPASAAPPAAAPASAPASAPAPASTPEPPASAPAPAAVPVPPPAHPRPRPAPPAAVDTKGAKCSDILQKASLEPLTASETAYLKRECR